MYSDIHIQSQIQLVNNLNEHVEDRINNYFWEAQSTQVHCMKLKAKEQ